MTYRVGDMIAHPLHGAGRISAVEEKRINGAVRKYYVLRLPAGDMLVMIPVEACGEVGVRPIVSRAEAEQIMAAIPGIEVSITQNWNKRYRENMLRIRSGDLMEVAAVIKGLMARDRERGLSTGERKMLHSAQQIIISELVLSDSSTYDEVEKRLDTAMIS